MQIGWYRCVLLRWAPRKSPRRWDGQELPCGCLLCCPSSRLLLSREKQSLGDLATSGYFCRPVSSTASLPSSQAPTGSKGVEDSGGQGDPGAGWVRSGRRAHRKAWEGLSLHVLMSILAHVPRSLSKQSPNPVPVPQQGLDRAGRVGGGLLSLLAVTLGHGRLGLLCGCHLISPGLRKRRRPAGGWSLGWDKETG